MQEALESLFFGTGAIEAVQQLIGPGHPRPFELLSLLGDTWGILLVIGLAFWLWGRGAAYGLVALLALVTPTKELIGALVSLPRPQGPDITVYVDLQVASFPSGHILQVFVLWGLLYAWHRVPLLAPLLVALLIGVSRLYLGVHYLGDVVFAVLIGAVLVWGFQAAWPHVQPWLARRGTGFYVGLGLLAILAIVGSMIFKLNNPRRWEILGLVAGGLAGFLLERRYVAYQPGRPVHPVRMILAGTAGIVLCLIVDRLFPEGASVPGVFTCGAAILWAVLGAPALFTRLGWIHATAPTPSARETYKKQEV